MLESPAVLRRSISAVLALAAAACAVRSLPAPSLFPMAQLWIAPLDAHIRGPLATDGRRVFVATGDGTLRGLDLLSGASVWRIENRPGVVSAREGLLVARGALGTVWGMDPATGSARWKTETAIAGPLAAAFDGDRVVIAGEGIALLDAASGKVLWSIPDEPKVGATPVAAGPCLLVPEEGGTLRCREPGTGRSIWTYETGGPLSAAPLVDNDGRVLLGTSARMFVAVSLEKGHRQWRWKLGADVRTSPAILDDLVVFASHEAVIYALRRGGGNLAWRATLPSRPLAPPLLLGEGVIVSCYGARPSENLLVGIDGRNGKRIGELRTPAEVQGQPLLVGDRLLLPLRDLRVVAFQLAAPSDADTPTPPPGAPPHP